MPAPWDGYFEREAAKAWHYKLPEWQRECPIARADMMAHEIEKSMRDAYGVEMRNPELKKKRESERGPSSQWISYRKKLGIA